MTPVEESMPDTDGAARLMTWLWTVVAIGLVTLALAGLVEWLK